MKRNDIKEMIRQSILAEFNMNEDYDVETGNSDVGLRDLYEPLKEDATDKIEQAIKSKKINPEAVKAAAEKALRGDSTELAVLMATGTNFAQLEEAEEEEISDEETIDIEAPAPDVPADMPADTTMVAEPTYTPEEAALMSDLDDALKKSQDIGDEKLATLIGNIITYFTRQHVVKEGEAGKEKHYKGAVKDDEDQISKLKKDMKFDKKQLKTESLEILKMKKLAGLLTEGEYAKALLKEEEEKSNKQKLIDAGYSESDAEDFANEFEQGGVKVPQKVKDILSKEVDMYGDPYVAADYLYQYNKQFDPFESQEKKRNPSKLK